MWSLNRLLGGALDALLGLFGGLPSAVGLTAVSVLATVGILLVFRRTSNQPGLAAAKRRIQASILEIRLLNEDPRFVLAAQRDALRHTAAYLGLTIVPLLWLALPLLVLAGHLQDYYGYQGLAVGEPVIVKAQFVEGVTATPLLEAGAGLVVETPVLWLPSPNGAEADWRVEAVAPGRHQLRVRLGEVVWTKEVLVSESPGRRSALRPSASWFAQLLHPSEPPIARGSPLVAIEVGYPPAEINLFGWRTSWVVMFLLLTLLAALALRGVLRVTF